MGGFRHQGVPFWGPYYKGILLFGGFILGVPYLRKPPHLYTPLIPPTSMTSRSLFGSRHSPGTNLPLVVQAQGLGLTNAFSWPSARFLPVWGPKKGVRYKGVLFYLGHARGLYTPMLGNAQRRGMARVADRSRLHIQNNSAGPCGSRQTPARAKLAPKKPSAQVKSRVLGLGLRV